MLTPLMRAMSFIVTVLPPVAVLSETKKQSRKRYRKRFRFCKTYISNFHMVCQ